MATSSSAMYLRYLGRITILVSAASGMAYADTQDAVSKLDAVIVESTQEPEDIQESGLKVDVINTGEYLSSSRDISDLLNTTAGINIRQSGGLGSSSELSLNGLSGNRIRYFIDGIPMESFGSSMSLENFPVNSVESIEVFKGVVPIHLGADALGGAINITTPTLAEDFIDASYSVGSFDTHRLAVNAQKSNDAGYFFKVGLFVNDTDNSYTVKDVPVTDELGNKIGTADAERFHDAYRSSLISLQGGVTDKKFADELSTKVTYATNKDEQQHPETSINNVFGDLYTENESWMVSSIYKKEWDKLSLNAFLLKGRSTNLFDDTSAKNYDWFGNYVAELEPLGEFSTQSKLTTEDDILRGNLHGKYKINDQHSVAAGFSHNYVDRSGEDSVNQTNTSFSQPNWVKKSVLGTSYNYKTKSNKLSATAFAKQYNYKAEINAEQYIEDSGDVIVTTKADQSNTGYGVYGGYEFSPNLKINASFEKAFRLPEADEILGDGEKYVRANPDLGSEESDNFNLGLSNRFSKSKFKISNEINLFHRNAQDYIQFYADRVVQGTYRNVDDVRIQGVELSTGIKYDNKYSLDFNITNQKLTNLSRLTAAGLTNTAFDSDLPNEPTLFGNIRLGYHHNSSSKNSFAVYWNTKYVDSFPLFEGEFGNQDDKNIIPSQLSHDLELEWSNYSILPFAQGANVSLMLQNITDETLYDNFSIQKPGRAVYLKFGFEM